MAKVSFTKLGLKVNQDIKTFTFNEQVIEVKQYLPSSDKLKMINTIINLSAEDNNFSNPMKIKIFTALGIVEYYTNINFTEKQKEDFAKLYDTLVSSGLLAEIYKVIPQEEYEDVLNSVQVLIKAIYTYRNSVMGVLDIISTDYSDLEFNAENLSGLLSNPSNLALLKDVMTKLG